MIRYFFLSTLLLLTCGTTYAEKPRLGIILPLSGKAAVGGQSVKNSLILANERLALPFELIFEDNALDNTRSVSAFRKLSESDKIAGLVVYASGPANTIAPLAEKHKIPMIGLCIDPNVANNRKWVMTHWASNAKVAHSLVDELKKRNFTRVAIVTAEVQGLLGLQDAFLKTAAAAGIDIVMSEKFLPTDVDFQSFLPRLNILKPDAIFINLYYGQVGLFSRQAATLGLHSQLFSQFTLEDSAEIKAARGKLAGAFFASVARGDLSFEREYRRRFNAPPALGGIGSYDVLLLFAAAFRESDGSPEGVNTWLHNVKEFPAKAGVYGALENNTFDVPVELREVGRE